MYVVYMILCVHIWLIFYCAELWTSHKYVFWLRRITKAMTKMVMYYILLAQCKSHRFNRKRNFRWFVCILVLIEIFVEEYNRIRRILFCMRTFRALTVLMKQQHYFVLLCNFEKNINKELRALCIFTTFLMHQNYERHRWWEIKE